MRHAIDPTVDCVFKALLGADNNRNLLIHFLNAVLQNDLEQPIVEVEIINPYNEKEFLDDKLSIVDVKVRDPDGQLYQIEIQLSVHHDLPQRMLYMWADLYSKQIKSGEEYERLKPTYSIWLLEPALIKQDQDYAHHFRMQNDQGKTLVPHGGIYLLELAKFQPGSIDTELARWLQFFKEGKSLDDEQLPNWMHTDEMRQAMSTLKEFSEKERIYSQYQARLDYQRVQKALERDKIERERVTVELERAAIELECAVAKAVTEKDSALAEKDAALVEKSTALTEKDSAIAEKDSVIAEKDAALVEIDQLRALLQQQGSQPDN
jgi:predicted transposase/invertase (TIGR01784 family)